MDGIVLEQVAQRFRIGDVVDVDHVEFILEAILVDGPGDTPADPAKAVDTNSNRHGKPPRDNWKLSATLRPHCGRGRKMLLSHTRETVNN
jgi:hypothetical protein